MSNQHTHIYMYLYEIKIQQSSEKVVQTQVLSLKKLERITLKQLTTLNVL